MTRAGVTFDPALELTVVSRQVEAADVAVLGLRSTAGGELPQWAPGAHVAVRVGQDQVREYSLCGDPADRGEWTIGVRLAPQGRGGSRHVHEALQVGSRTQVVRLANLFPFAPTARPLFVAAGIGITPILAMMHRAQADGLDWSGVYVGRTTATMPLLDRAAGFGDRVRCVQTRVDGRLDLAALLREHPGHHVYACGPAALLDELVAAGRRSGTPVSVERFVADAPAEDTAAAADSPFDVLVASTGQRVHVPCGQSALSALLGAGVRVANSCGEGTCGSCETPIVDGRADHRDAILTDDEREENEFMYVCVSRAVTPTLTLDL